MRLPISLPLRLYAYRLSFPTYKKNYKRYKRTFTHKYLDDTTISETFVKDTVSEMQLAVNALIEWSELNRMTTNCKKQRRWFLDQSVKSRQHHC